MEGDGVRVNGFRLDYLESVFLPLRVSLLYRNVLMVPTLINVPPLIVQSDFVPFSFQNSGKI